MLISHDSEKSTADTWKPTKSRFYISQFLNLLKHHRSNKASSRRIITIHPLPTTRTRVSMVASGNLQKNSKKKKIFPPSQFTVDEHTGEKWRLCAGAAVFNSNNELLVGERIFISDAWQAPQGGVDDSWKPEGEPELRKKETILEACNRELYEEMGIEVGKHAMIETSTNKQIPPVRYNTSGTSSWLTKAGFAGQEMHWTIYRCIDALGDKDPSTICDLSGKNGEDPEFVRVKWENMNDVVANIWEGKREPYKILSKTVNGMKHHWYTQVSSLDFTGRWSRDASLSDGLVEALVARGLTEQKAKQQAGQPYIQSWQRKQEDNNHNENAPPTWIVTTYGTDGITRRRELNYVPGEWDEICKGDAVIFGKSNSDGFVLRRRTTFLAEPDASPLPIAHVTVTDGPRGVEESRRYLKEDSLLLRRTFYPSSDNLDQSFISTEVFVKTNET